MKYVKTEALALSVLKVSIEKNTHTHTHTHVHTHTQKHSKPHVAQLHTAEPTYVRRTKECLQQQAPNACTCTCVHMACLSVLAQVGQLCIIHNSPSLYVYKQRHMCICTCTCMWHVITIHVPSIGHVIGRSLHMHSGLKLINITTQNEYIFSL